MAVVAERRQQLAVKYGVKPTVRPKVQAVKHLDLSGETGAALIKVQTKLVLRTHRVTFSKLADM